MAVVNTSALLRVVLECALADLAITWMMMKYRVMILTNVPSMVAKVTVDTPAPTLRAQGCAAAPLVINCFQMECLVKVSKCMLGSNGEPMR